MKICVIGLGYVGAVTSICLARDGHQVLGVDTDATKIDLLRNGHSPVVEEGVQELTRQVVDEGRLSVASELPAEVADYDVTFVCVGTPSADNGSQDLSAIGRVTQQIGAILGNARSYPVVVYRSTLQPGTMSSVVRDILESESGRTVGVDFGLCFQPEFLREGSSIRDFDSPPMTVVGGDSARSVDRLRDLFGHLDCEFIETDIGVAEVLKLTCNAFHAMKVGFANEIGRIGQAVNVDSRKVMDILCRDRVLNISPAYLRPGFAFGGSCLPKDLRALSYVGRQADLRVPILDGIMTSNATHIEHAQKLVMGSGSRKVGILGLSFKQGTDDLRESPVVALAEQLIGKGYELKVYDPVVQHARLIGSNLRFIEATIPHIGALITSDLDDVLEHADVLVLAHQNASIREAVARHLGKGGKVIDLAGISAPDANDDGYVGICW